MNDSTVEVPRCFGKEFLPSASECVGGHDMAFNDDHGGHLRPPCDFVSTCSARTQALKNSRFISPQSLVRPPTSFHTSNYASTPYSPPTTSQPQHHQYPPVSASGGFQQMMPVNYGLPQYLTVREPVTNGTLMRRLGVEVIRSMGKSLGHTIAHFFDVEVFTRREDGPPR